MMEVFTRVLSRREFTVPMPSPLRILLHLLAALLLGISLYICIQGALILYDAYQFLTWLQDLDG
jgi:hypothetical protein